MTQKQAPCVNNCTSPPPRALPRPGHRKEKEKEGLLGARHGASLHASLHAVRFPLFLVKVLIE